MARRPPAALAVAALALALAVPAGADAAPPAKPRLHFLTTQEFPGPPTYHEWGGEKPKKLKPRGCWEPVLAGTPTTYRLYASDPTSGRDADPGGTGGREQPAKAAVAFGVQYIAVTKNAAAAESLVIAIKERLKECARTEVGTPKRPRSAEFAAYGAHKVGDELLIRGIHHKFTVSKKNKKGVERRQAVDVFGIGRDGRLVTVVSLTSVREQWGRSGWSPASVVKGFTPTAKAGVDRLR